MLETITIKIHENSMTKKHIKMVKELRKGNSVKILGTHYALMSDTPPYRPEGIPFTGVFDQWNTDPRVIELIMVEAKVMNCPGVLAVYRSQEEPGGFASGMASIYQYGCSREWMRGWRDE
jgi:hypothetical protein